MPAARHPRLILSLIVLCAFVVAVFIGAPAIAKEKITKADDLPRYTYEVTTKPSDILANDADFAELAARVKKDIESIFETYDIEDATTLQQYYRTYYTLLWLEGNHKESLEYLEKTRALEKKEPAKLMMGMLAYAYLAALEKHKDPTSDAFKSALEADLSARLAELPWETVQDRVQQMNGQMAMLSEQMFTGLVQSQLDPAVETSGYLSGDQAVRLVSLRNVIVNVMPYKEQLSTVLSAAVASHEEEKKENIWPARDVTLAQDSDMYTPVIVGVWDAGVDTDVFEGHLFKNARETFNQRDDDKNGYVDDVYGIAYDLNHDKTPDLLYSLGDYADRRDDLEGHLKGFADLNASIDSPEAMAVKQEAAKLQAEEVQEFFEMLSLYSHYAHGTHVAGITIEGNPYAKVLAARLSFDHRMVPDPYTVELIEKFGKEFKEVTHYFKENNVRVVNMSWGFSLKEIEQTLEVNGIGASSEERGEMAREMFNIAKRDLYEAFQNAPDVLFVGAAGNSDNDVEFDEFIPSSFELPNLMIVGAVDQAGETTSFTSGGRTVAVYANGFEVDSYVPGGNRMELSGTSMASPNVANLAAKLLARDPSLTPEQVIELIKSGADDFGKDQPMWVINPQRSMELLEKKVARKSG
jgi:hypothetical protein